MKYACMEILKYYETLDEENESENDFFFHNDIFLRKNSSSNLKSLP